MKKSNDGDDHGVVVSFILVVCSVFIFGRQLYCMFSFMYYLQHERPCCISEIQTGTEGESHDFFVCVPFRFLAVH